MPVVLSNSKINSVLDQLLAGLLVNRLGENVTQVLEPQMMQEVVFTHQSLVLNLLLEIPEVNVIKQKPVSVRSPLNAKVQAFSEVQVASEFKKLVVVVSA